MATSNSRCKSTVLCSLSMKSHDDSTNNNHFDPSLSPVKYLDIWENIDLSLWENLQPKFYICSQNYTNRIKSMNLWFSLLLQIVFEKGWLQSLC